MIMKRGRILTSILCVSIFVSIGLMGSRAADDLPKRLNFDRYQGMLKRSPFAVATAALPAATPGIFKDLYVANAAKSSEGDMVTIASSADKNFKEYLTTKEPVHGYSIASIEWSDQVGQTKVTISKDGQFATLTFNQALVITPTQNAPPTSPVVQGMQPAPQPGFPRPGQVPAVPTPPPHVRGVIQRNPAPLTPVPGVTPQLEQ
jgi:hypothetical protein